MPVLGSDMEAGTLVAWRKRPGDPVRRGDIIAEVETEKGLIEVEVFDNGVVEKLLVEPGTKVPVGTVLALIREEGAPARPAAARPRATPAARRLAAERGVDVATLVGTGPEGAITREDVERAGAARPPRAVEPAPDQAARMRQAIAAAMARSKREVPHFYLSTTIDLGPALAWLARTNESRPVTARLLPGALLLKATALALREHPELNAHWVEGRPVPRAAVHVGMAIALRDGGLVAPAIHDTERRTLDELMGALRDLVARARAGTLRSSELSDPTITVTSLGDQGVETVFGVIYPPQVAIVGFGRIVKRPWVVEGGVAVRPVVTAALSADHRVTDGHRAARFLAAIDRYLQEPEGL